jgi:hypothetical protein
MKVAWGRYAAFASVLCAAGLFALIHFPAPPRVTGAPLQQPGLPLNMSFDPSNLDANTQQLYQSMQDAINGYAITPANRTTYFSAVYNSNGFVANGWAGTITNVQPNGNGYLVSVDVIPCMSCEWAACAIIVDSDYYEQYQVFPDGTFQYVGSFDPQGLAGQMPTIIGL